MSETNVEVCCRVRPSHPREFDEPGTYKLLEIDEKSADGSDDTLRLPRVGKQFSFQNVFSDKDTSEHVFVSMVRPLVDNVFMGMNTTFICYGHTGTGKTYTMSEGMAAAAALGPSPSSGVLVHSVDHALKKISCQNSFRLQFGCLQLYRDSLEDLLHPDGPRCPPLVNRNPSDHVTLSRSVTTFAQFAQIFAMAEKHRVVASTHMNKQSSRGHTVLIMAVTNTETNAVTKMFFVDLAGYERLKQTLLTDTVRLDEARHINLSLTALATVISSLTMRSSYVPYRNSKLTRILQDSLGGNSRTSILLTLGPSSAHVSDTINTLHFGMSALQCKTTVLIESGPVDYKKECLRLQKSVDDLTERLAQAEHSRASTATELELTLQVSERRNEELGLQIECLEQEVMRVQEESRDMTTQYDDLRQQKEAMQTAYHELTAEVEALRRCGSAATTLMPPNANDITIQKEEDDAEESETEAPSSPPPVSLSGSPPRHRVHSSSPRAASATVTSLSQTTATSATDFSGSDASSITASGDEETSSSSSGDDASETDDGSDSYDEDGDTTDDDDESDSSDDDDDVEMLKWRQDAASVSYMNWMACIQTAKALLESIQQHGGRHRGHHTLPGTTMLDVAQFFEYFLTSSSSPELDLGSLAGGVRVQHPFTPATTFVSGLPTSCYSPDPSAQNCLLKVSPISVTAPKLASPAKPSGRVAPPIVPILRFTCQGKNSFEGETLVVKASLPPGAPLTSSVAMKRWFRVTFQPEAPTLAPTITLVATNTMTYTVRSEDLGSYLVFEYVVLDGNTKTPIGLPATIRTPQAIRPCIPSIANLRISGAMVCGGVLQPTYTFQEGTEGQPIVKWHSSVDGHSFSSALPIMDPATGAIGINADHVHHYMRVLVTPVRSADGARGNTVSSKLVYINVGEGIDESVQKCVIAGRRVARGADGRTSLELRPGYLIISMSTSSASKTSPSSPNDPTSHKIALQHVLVRCSSNNELEVILAPRGGGRNNHNRPALPSMCVTSPAERDEFVLTYRAFLALENARVREAALGSDGAAQWHSGTWTASGNDEVKAEIVYRQVFVVGRQLGKGFTRPGCAPTFLHFVEELLMYDLYDTVVKQEQSTAAAEAHNDETPVTTKHSVSNNKKPPSPRRRESLFSRIFSSPAGDKKNKNKIKTKSATAEAKKSTKGVKGDVQQQHRPPHHRDPHR
eukprot:PhM_4_TR15259/c0_g1_i1/m.8410